MELLDKVKIINGITEDKHDDYLNVMLPLLIDFVKTECNNQFRKQGKTVLPGGVELFIAKAAKHNMGGNVKSKKMGTVSYTYELDFPPEVYRYLAPYRRMKFHAF